MSKQLPLVLRCGIDWGWKFDITFPDGSAASSLSNFQMDIRRGTSGFSPLVIHLDENTYLTKGVGLYISAPGEVTAYVPALVSQDFQPGFCFTDLTADYFQVEAGQSVRVAVAAAQTVEIYPSVTRTVTFA